MTRIKKKFLYANHLWIKLWNAQNHPSQLKKIEPNEYFFILILNLVFLNCFLLTNKFICIICEKRIKWTWWAKQGPAEKQVLVIFWNMFENLFWYIFLNFWNIFQIACFLTYISEVRSLWNIFSNRFLECGDHRHSAAQLRRCAQGFLHCRSL